MSLKKIPSFFLDFSEPDMKGENGHTYCFGSFTLNLPERRLSDGGNPVSLTPKAFDVLSVLVERAGHLVEKEELMSRVWPDSFVEEANVARIIHTLRKTLRDDGNGKSFIETVPTKGYRFVAVVETLPETRVKVSSVRELVQNAPISAESAESAGLTATDRRETPVRHRILLMTAIVLVGLLATGFWMSNGKLMPSIMSKLSKHSLNGEAYRNYQQGALLLETRTPENYKKALEHFEKAIELDPAYADAYAGKADAKSYQFSGSALNDDIASARTAAKKALELDPNNSYAHTIQCRILGTYDWEFEDAVNECENAVALGPNDDRAHREYGWALNVVGRPDEAISEMSAAVAISPTSYNKRSLGQLLYMSRRYDEAIEQLNQVDATDPGNTDVARWLFTSFLMKGDRSNAFKNLIKIQHAAGADQNEIAALESAYATDDLPAAIRLILEREIGTGKKKSMLTASLYAQIGANDKAFETLDDMRKRRAIMRIAVAREPMLDPIRDDPRYTEILSQMQLK